MSKKETTVKAVKKLTMTQLTKMANEAAVEVNVTAYIAKANELQAKREKFERTVLARSNKALYGILAETYALVKSAVADGCLKELAIELRNALKERGIKVQGNTPAMTVFVRYVFNSDRQRAYNYTRTLIAALSENIAVENLADFIEGKNGVEECKKVYAVKAETKQKREDIEKASHNVIDALRTMKATKRVKLADSSVNLSDGSEFAFIVARACENGEYELLRVVPKTTKGMQKSAVNELAKHLIVEQELAKIRQKKANSIKVTDAAAAAMTLNELAAAA
jgi:hypothetical protein